MRNFARQYKSKEPWDGEKSMALYDVDQWGGGYFGINAEGHLTVRPMRKANSEIDLKGLVDALKQRDIKTPLLIRFNDLLRDRLDGIAEAFNASIREYEYKGDYKAVYPIKVNQQRHVVEQVLEFGKEYGFGVEAGSKPELLAVLAMVDDDDMPIVCNGFKDEQYIEAVVLAKKMGRNIIPVVEKLSELRLIVDCAKKHEVRPHIGIRVKLSAHGSGKWVNSSGPRSKFGLVASEVVDAMDFLKDEGMLECLRLLHSHLGSQLNSISHIKRAVNEMGRIYCELAKMGAGMEMIDVGGGLAVDYDGTQSGRVSSMNYSLQEYANNIVFHFKEICDAEDVKQPTIISESGRAMVSYSSLLIFDVLGWSGYNRLPAAEFCEDEVFRKLPKPIQTLHESYRDICKENYLEYYHDSQINRDEVLSLFSLGYCTLRERGLAERLFYGICSKVYQIAGELEEKPKELAGLEEMLADTYFLNGSIFQSLPDSWAIGQQFPIMPIHRLDEKPTCLGKLVDITCDSDGRIERFISKGEKKSTLELHALTGDDYYVGVFLVGAYQEILGDMHNLFGDTNAVHVSLDENGEVLIDEVVEGDTVKEVLEYVQFDTEDLRRAMRQAIEKAVRKKTIDLNEGNMLRKFYEKGLAGYTYLN